MSETESKQVKLMLIGGYPKGFDVPFSEETLSGKRLWNIIRNNNLQASVMDLWNNAEEEKLGRISDETIQEIKKNMLEFRVIALGNYVYEKITLQGLKVYKLPHPASRRKNDLEALEKGLKELSFMNKYQTLNPLSFFEAWDRTIRDLAFSEV